ncbi:translation initiation factor IF-2 [Lutispora saccharofermentans]|uniref:Translation initiation factor IF-2 n=1 Tax=Lutispora saccharofermentans TaxID=3024236 RepID=A0ABT1N9N6_9FIRM|nr:translation initiation factor IF-2 [Lutispora saccharofermentans]MCQ1527953.1 translation initiation factor IF-2 [Lutispora saccharofermentans]
MSKKRLYELAKELGLSSKELINKAREANININNHMSNIESDEEKAIRELFIKKNDKKTDNKVNVTVDNKQKTALNKSSLISKEQNKDTAIEDYDGDFNKKEESKKIKKAVPAKKPDKPVKRGNFRNDRKRGRPMPSQPVKEEPSGPKKPIKVGNSISVKDLSEKTGKTVAEIIKKLLLLGIVATINQELDYDTAALIAGEFGISIEKAVDKDDEELLLNDTEDKEEDLKPRPPVVTIMGHVDHGKTSLLDAVRQTNVIATEAGGITQHIGAYTVNIEGKKIAFLDTPGHEAFTAMRARGAKVTDIAILVVAADDGVMPQTIEAINHAKAANVTIIVAINKIDKPGANPDRVKQELTEHGLLAEDWGGDTICVPVSAKKKIGIENLLEMVLLVAEMQELKANPNRKAKGTVIEAKLDKSRGPIATVLVQNGTLNVGDFFIVGTTYGKVRTMTDDKGKAVKKAGPSTPVEITGLSEVPDAGDIFIIVADEKVARQISDKRKEKYRQEHLQSNQRISLDDLFSQIQAGKVKELNLIVKADVQGSVEALKQSLERLSNDEVKIKAIHGGVGAITETDVMFASASNAIIIGFNVRPQAAAVTLSEKDKVDIRLYRVIYDAIEDIESAMKGMLEPEYKEVVLGHAEVRAIFKASSIGTIAGCYVTDGKINRNNEVRVVRDGVVIHEGKISSLKRFKDDAKEVNTGFECGISLDKFNDIKEGDVIESFTMEAVPRK